MLNPLIWGDDPVREIIGVAVVFLFVGLFNAWKLGRLPVPKGGRKWTILCGAVLVLLLGGVWLIFGK